MKNKIVLGLASLMLSAVMFTSCSKMPQAEIDAANLVIAEAKTAGADIYVHESYVALQDSMNSIMVNVEAQKSKLIKNFGKVKEQLVSVTQMAQDVKQKTETRKEELKAEIQNTIAEVQKLIADNHQLILEAPKGKEGTSALLAIKDELGTIEASINEAGTMLASGEIMATLDKVKAAKEKAVSINTELSGVIAKYKANIKGRKG